MTKQMHIFLPIVAAILLLLYAYGCEPRTASLISASEKVTRAELITEIDLLEYKLEKGIADLDRQERIRDIIFQQGLIAAQTGTVNPVGIITALMSILGVGAVADDIKLRKKIKTTSSAA